MPVPTHAHALRNASQLPPCPRGRVTLACLALLAGAAAPVLAQEAGPPGQGEAPTTQPSSAQRLEIVARQSSTDLRRAASVAKQIYGREELDRFGDTNALDVLRRLPGVNVGAGGPRMRGLGSGYTQILINGDPAPQGFALDQLSPAQIERIEVLRAPTAEQSAQAIAGTINIILKDPPRRTQRELRLGLANGTERPVANANLTLGESKGGLSTSLPLSLFEWQRENINTTERRLTNEDKSVSQTTQRGEQQVWGWGFNVGPRLNWKISDVQTLALQGFAQKGYWNNRTDFNPRRTTDDPMLEDDARQSGFWQNLRGNVTWINRFANDQRVELRAGVQQSTWGFDARTERLGLEQVHSVGGGRDEGVTQAGKYSWLLGQNHTLTLGWDLEARSREETRTSTLRGVPMLPEFEGQPFDAKVRRTALYLQDEWEVSPQLQLYLGLRSERIRTQTAGDATSAAVLNSSSVLSPLAHLTYKFDAKGRDVLRASLTRSYKAPNLGALLPRPVISANYADTHADNKELAPDRIGNPLLAPELSVGLDLAFEKYLPGGGMWSVGMFHRRISGVVRTNTTRYVPHWAHVERYVAQPVNFSDATTSGLEFEIRGRATELFPTLLSEAKNLNLRASANLYRSRVAVLPGPDNRLDGQQPWSATLGFDNRFAPLPLNVGGSLSLMPAYDTQLIVGQTQLRSRTATLDLFAQWTFRPGLSMRLAMAAGVQPFGPPNGYVTTLLRSGDFTRVDRHTGPQFNWTLDVRL